MSSSTSDKQFLRFEYHDSICCKMFPVSSASIFSYLLGSSISASTLDAIMSLFATTNREDLSCKKTDTPLFFSSLNSLNACDSIAEMFDGNFTKFCDERREASTELKKISISSEAFGAAFSVLVYHGGLMKGSDSNIALGSADNC